MFRSGLRFGPWMMIVMLAGLTACSQDKHVFISTVNLPTTVTLYDPMADQSVWSKDIPVGQKLVIDLDRENEEELYSISGMPATLLTWELYDIDSTELLAEAETPLPGVPIVIKINYRPSPEYAPGYVPPYATTAPAYTVPAVEPAVQMPMAEDETMAVQPAEPVDSMEPVEPMDPMGSIEAEPMEVEAPVIEMPEVEIIEPEQPAEPAMDEIPDEGPLEAPMEEAEEVAVPEQVEEEAVIEVSPMDIELEMELEESLLAEPQDEMEEPEPSK